MSPVRVKLRDFGISKRIQPQDTTKFHTQVSIQIYGAPGVLGSDSKLKWNFGLHELCWHSATRMCNIWVTCRVRGPSISLLLQEISLSRRWTKSIISSDRRCRNFILKAHAPNTAWRLPYRGGCTGQWVVGGLKSDNEDSRDDQDETAQNRNESTRGRQSEGELTPQDKPKKRRQETRLHRTT